jgi:hypothetical protein
MSDIITELRERSLRAEQEGDPLALLDEAADEIKRLRQEKVEMLAAGDRLEGQLFSVAKQRDALRLTDAEREAICRVYDLLCDRSRELQSATRFDEARQLWQWAKKLQGLWERTGGGE